jgi:alcohol dehydrogenase (cytochrome c)
VKTKDGREMKGMRRNEDTYTLLMTDLHGNLQRFDKKDLVEEHYDDKSLMPSYATTLTPPEIQDLVAYMKSLKARDFTKTIEVDAPGGLTFNRLRNSDAEPQNWMTYWGDYKGHHYSALKQITAANAKQLQVRWSAQMAGESILETTPVVIDGIMYVTGPPGQVFAIDAKSGLQIWKYERKQKVVSPYQINPFNRGVAVLGNRVFFGTLDAALVALNAKTGLPVWETQIADTMQGFNITEAPLAIDGKIIVGIAGGEFGTRDFLDAYDPATGKRIWRFYTIPGPGEFGNDTWKGESWKHGGAPAWLTGSYDPDLNVLYWGLGNAGPDIDADVREGDNLFSCSVVALDPATGQRKWHYQFTPGDSHDWDAAEDLMLVDRVYHGQNRKLVLQGNRNGMFYVLDRTNGKFLLGKPFVKQTWNKGFDENGRPIVTPDWRSSPEGHVVYPSVGGGTNWQAPSYDPATGWFYLIYHESGQRYVRTTQTFEAGKQYMGGRGFPAGGTATAGVRAIDPETGEIKWDYPISRTNLGAGVLATAGGVLFVATGEGNFIALDSKKGTELWHFQTGATVASSPMSYAVNGKQYVSIGAGNVLYTLALPD